jgi:hypothetical protein
MAKNTYNIVVTLETVISVEADSDQDAFNMVSDEIHEAGYGELDIVASRIDTVNIDGPAKYELYVAACQVYFDAKDAHGKDSPQAKAAWDAIPKDAGY